MRSQIEGEEVPDPNEEYLFYQTLIGCWPLESASPEEDRRFIERIRNYMDKAAKEAKLNTSWVRPNLGHDRALARFIEAALRRDPDNAFLSNFVSFVGPIATAGMLNSVSQTLLKIASPGVPDFYQGTEHWDLSLVDPDNRRPVDYRARRRLLAKLRSEAASDPAGLSDRLLRELHQGELKTYIINRGLCFRREHRELFASGAYAPIEPAGERRRQIIAFARSYADQQLIVVAGRFFLDLCGHSTPSTVVAEGTWTNTFLSAPPDLLHQRYVDVFTGRTVEADRERDARQLAMAEIFAHLPFAMLVAQGQPAALPDLQRLQ